MTFGTVLQAAKWHMAHKIEEASPARQLQRMREQLSELQGKMTALAG